MPQYFQHQQIDKQKWDACVEASTQKIVYGLSWYLDVVAPGWAALIVVEDEKYIAVLPLPEGRKFGIKYVFQPFFCPQLGVFSTKNINLNKFVQALKKQYRFVSNYCFNIQNTEQVEAGKSLQIKQYFTHHLDLARNYELMYQDYSRDRKLNLNRARKAGLKIIASQDIKPIIQLFREDAESRIYGGANLKAYQMLVLLYEQLQKRGLATLLYSQTAAGELDSGCLFITYAHKIIYIFNAASKAGRKHNGRSLIIDSVIQKHAGQPFIFDFESPPAVSNIIRVYHGFGSEPVPYYTLLLNRLPKPVWFMKETRRKFYQEFLPAIRLSSQK